MTYEELIGFCSQDRSREILQKPWMVEYQGERYAVATDGARFVAVRGLVVPELKIKPRNLLPLFAAVDQVVTWSPWPRAEDAEVLHSMCKECRNGKALRACSKCGGVGCAACEEEGEEVTETTCPYCLGTVREYGVLTPEGYVRRHYIEQIGRLDGPVEMGVLPAGKVFSITPDGRPIFFRFADGFGAVMPLYNTQSEAAFQRRDRLAGALMARVDAGDQFEEISIERKLGFVWCFGLDHNRDEHEGEPNRNWDEIENSGKRGGWVNLLFRSAVRNFVSDQIEATDVEPACRFFGVKLD